MIEYCEDTERKARKDHRCDECGATIWAGEKYWEFRWLYDGRWCQMKRCAPCTLLIQRQKPDCEGSIAPIVEWMGQYDILDVVADDELLAFELRHMRSRASSIKRDDPFAVSKLNGLVGEYEALCEVMANRLRGEE